MHDQRLAIIGGTGFDKPPSFLDGRAELRRGVDFDVWDIEDTLFVSRHGTGHELSPDAIPYEQHADFLRGEGVTHVISTIICGSLISDITPGTLGLPDQIIDFSARRLVSDRTPGFVHLPFADPYCQPLREILSTLIRDSGLQCSFTQATVAVIAGPRFSTRAEAELLRRNGGHLVNMTQMPEAYLARKIGAHYASIGFVTDRALLPNQPKTSEDDDSNFNTPSVKAVLARFNYLVSCGNTIISRLCDVGLPSTTSPRCRCANPLPSEYYKNQ